MEDKLTINYLDNGNVEVISETLFENDSDYFDAIGDYDVVTCDEINPTSDHWFIDNDGTVFSLCGNPTKDLKTELNTIGQLKDLVDLDKESDFNFVFWFLGCNGQSTKEEVLNQLIEKCGL